MGHKLLTGATGLLGGYLLRDLLVRDQSVAVLVRPSRHETAEQRVEAVLSHWEDQWGRWLPRPVILRGDITRPMLGLDRHQRSWARRHCDCVLHSAANLTFYEDEGEPWKSNVDGVRYLLEFCREADVRELAHVSSAYVCGLRTGRVYESELDVGQQFGNDYERSKLMAEQLVRSDDHLEAFTIFRPTIITGDSRTGFSLTFHGFYTPLRLACALATRVCVDEMFEVDYLGLLGLRGDEHKNFVPVDWVSDAIVSILTRCPHQNKTYALASSHPVTAARLQTVFEEAVRRFDSRAKRRPKSREKRAEGAPADGASPAPSGTEALEKALLDQFAVYRSYWRDDPEFDCTNTRSALPDKPCPELSDGVLLMLCRYAVEGNFGGQRRSMEPLEFSLRDWIGCHGQASEADGAGTPPKVPAPSPAIVLTVTGSGGGCWTIRCAGNGTFSYSEGRSRAPTEGRMNWRTFRDLVRGRSSLDEALLQGRAVLYGDQAGISQLRRLMQPRAEASAGAAKRKTTS